MFNYMRKQVELICPECKEPYRKDKSEHDRNLKLNRISYCSLNCASVHKMGNFKGKRNTKPPLVNPSKMDDFSPFRECLRRVNSRSKNKGLETNLTLEYLKQVWNNQNGICPYTGYQMTMISYLSDKQVTDMSLDRINSKDWYVKGNVQFVAVVANFLKSTFSHEETINVCKQIANHWK